jgi:glycosyltransferase involved in cell wall biosynthesis
VDIAATWSKKIGKLMPKHAPLLSVVVATYGRQAFLSQALDSVLLQTVEDFECIVVDDGSPQPVEIPRDPRIRLVRRPDNGGPAAARNTGIDNALGRYIAFLDDDDAYTPERLGLAIQGLRHTPVSICWRGNVSDDRPVVNRVLEDFVYDTILEAEVPHLGQTALLRTLAPHFNEGYQAAEDTEWWLRVSSLAPVTTIRRVGYLFRVHDEARHGNDLPARVRHRLMLLDEYSGYFAARPGAAAYQWKKIGLLAQRVGDRALARSAFRRSLRLRPSAATVGHLTRSLVTSSNRAVVKAIRGRSEA